MVTTAIPERVYALCKIVEKGSISVNDLKMKMEPDFLENGSVYFNDYKTAAQELGLIAILDDQVQLAVEPNIVKSIESMRSYANSRLENYNNGQFYRVTKAYFEKSAAIFKEDKNIANLGSLFSEMTGMPVDAVAMRAWRFWVTFLGFGYLHEMFVIPNACVFLKDLITNSKLESNVRYSISDFVNSITPMANIIMTDMTNRTFNYGTSNGLRSLQDMGMIRMEHIMDQADMWTLFPLKTYSNDPIVTHITIL